jgi:cell wall-associated NlpC family hydrolase
MPRRVNLIILLAFTVGIILSFGISAGALPAGKGQGADPGSELERLQREAGAANGAYKNALDEENQLNNQIAKTRQDLTENEGRLADTESSLKDRAEEIYKHGDLTMMDALTRASNVQEFTNVLGILVQQLGQDQDQAKKLRGERDTLQQTEKDLESQVEERKATLDKEAAKKDETQRAMDEAQAAFDSLKPEDQQKIRNDRLGRVQDAVKQLREGSGSQGEAPRSGSEDGTSGETQGETPKGGSGDEASEEDQGGTPTGDSGGDRERQAKIGWAIDQTLREWIAEGKLPAREGSTDESAGSKDPPPPDPMAELATDVAQQQAEANRQAKEAADQVTAEQEAQQKAAEQTKAAEDAKLATQQASEKKQSETQDAEDAQRQADLATKDAATQKAAAQKAADQAATQRKEADEATNQLAAKRATEAKKPQPGLPVEVSNSPGGAVDTGAKLVAHGDFSIDPGSKVTFEDADGTRGTATDGINARIVKGSIDTTMTGPLDNVSGGDGQMSTDGLQVVDTTGIAADQGGNDGAAGLQYAPNTGAAGLQYAPDTGTAGVQYAPNTGTAGVQYAPNTGTAGLQYAPSSGTAGLQYAPSTGASKLQYAPNTGTVGAPPKPASSGSQGGVVGEADTWLGVPYVFGGNSRSGIDCSAFTAAVYAKFGIVLPDSPAGQWGMGTPVVGPARAGDLVFWSEDHSGKPTHVGIADGKGNAIHASDYFMDVTVTPIGNIPGYLGARRFL